MQNVWEVALHAWRQPFPVFRVVLQPAQLLTYAFLIGLVVESHLRAHDLPKTGLRDGLLLRARALVGFGCFAQALGVGGKRRSVIGDHWILSGLVATLNAICFKITCRWRRHWGIARRNAAANQGD